MFCPECGSEIPDDSVFCMKCGAQIQQPTEQPYTPPPAVTPIPSPSQRTRFAGSGGVLIIIGACLCLVIGIITLLFFSYDYSYYYDEYRFDPTSIIVGIFCLISFALGITGSIFTFRRKMFPLAIMGSVFVIIGGCLSFVTEFFLGILFGLGTLVLGILGLIFIAISATEFLKG